MELKNHRNVVLVPKNVALVKKFSSNNWGSHSCSSHAPMWHVKPWMISLQILPYWYSLKHHQAWTHSRGKMYWWWPPKNPCLRMLTSRTLHSLLKMITSKHTLAYEFFTSVDALNFLVQHHFFLLFLCTFSALPQQLYPHSQSEKRKISLVTCIWNMSTTITRIPGVPRPKSHWWIS